MYSDRVDSVTRATNPSLLPSLPSTLLALLVRRPPPPPTRHLPMHRRIKHSLSIRQSSSFVVSLSLFLVTYSHLVFRYPSRPLASLTHSPHLVRFFSSLSLSAVSRYVLGVSSIISSSHPITLSLVFCILLPFHSFCYSISRYVSLSLT